MKTQKEARERASVILQVRAGRITAKQGAQMLGISRKTYYQWEKRALEGMIEQLTQQPPGRPPREVNPELEAMKTRIAQLETQLAIAEQTAEVRAILMDMRRLEKKRALKKKKTRSAK